MIMDDRLAYDEKASIGGKHLRANSLSLKNKGSRKGAKCCHWLKGNNRIKLKYEK